LLARGHSIGVVGIVDTYAPGALEGIENESPSDDSELLLDYAHGLARIYEQKPLLQREELVGLDKQEQLDCLAHRLEEAKLLPEGEGGLYLRRKLAIYKANIQMASQARPESSLPLPISLFAAMEQTSEQAPVSVVPLAEDLGWGRYASQPVAIHYVAGNHLSMMMRPHVGDLARALQTEMEAVLRNLSRE